MSNEKNSSDSFFKNGLSIDEFKMSILVISLVFSLLYAGVLLWLRGDITNNTTTVLTTLIISIAGVNVASVIKDFASGNRQVKSMVESNNSTPTQVSQQNYSDRI